jgi:hypothetical protein
VAKGSAGSLSQWKLDIWPGLRFLLPDRPRIEENCSRQVPPPPRQSPPDFLKRRAHEHEFQSDRKESG